MATTARLTSAGPASPETELVARARRRDEAAIRELVRRNNQRLFRVARAVLHNDAEAEDVVQETYVKAFTRLDSFEGKAAFSTWLTRIALNEAFGRRRRKKPLEPLDAVEQAESHGAELIPFPGATTPLSPEATTGRREMHAMLEQLIDALPDPFRVVFVLREIEEMSTEEVAAALGINAATVKTRLFRARRLLRAAIAARFADGFAAVYPFDGARCARLADRVVAALATPA
ncbi:MAG TPA: RNA polymerase sigma factor [Alphaproteobacteria bacterium]|nr:RNA polymerase sigma factor [Alphaproteobacteria bacterium]